MSNEYTMLMENAKKQAAKAGRKTKLGKLWLELAEAYAKFTAIINEIEKAEKAQRKRGG